jgi:CDGSH-type Zn-finger protein
MKNNKVHVFRKSKGQIVIEGPVILTDEDGNELPHGDRFSLCGCGKSKRMPYCDGSHKES